MQVLEGEEELDREETGFGIRTLSIDAAHGVRINGQTVKLRGACIHHDNGILGAATLPDAEERRIRQLKEAGFNAIRSSHHPAGRALLDACDRYGVLVMDELSDVWNVRKNPYDYALYFEQDWKPTGIREIDELTAYFHSQLRHFVLFRTLQVLGAYGFRGYFEKKPHFIQSVPFAIENLRQLLKNDYPEYPYLCSVLRELTGLKQFTDDIQKHMLEVKVMSFAYKKGIPNDPSGNGGGFVFDCRAVNNPGKYERYNHFTGLDEPVIQFLEDDGEITNFLEHVYHIVDASVKRYMDRGFTNLMICFGCTGGQHRSVYSAQHLAEHLNTKFGVKVHLVHREQNIEQLFNPTL